MVCAGHGHTVLLRSDGEAVAFGDNSAGQCEIPALPDGVTYVQVSAGRRHTVLLRSDGLVEALGDNTLGQCDVPPPAEGITYVQVSAGWEHTVLLRSDGGAVAFGGNNWLECYIPDVRQTFLQVAAGCRRTVYLLSDGLAFSVGCIPTGGHAIPELPEGRRYAQISLRWQHLVLLRDDGTAIACGSNTCGQCDLPMLEDGMKYTQVAAGIHSTVLLRSDGKAVACGVNPDGQRFTTMAACLNPHAGCRFVQASVDRHTVLLQSDGTVLAFGNNDCGQCVVPDCRTWLEMLTLSPPSLVYRPDRGQWPVLPAKELILQLRLVPGEGSGVMAVLCDMAGEERLRLEEHATTTCRELDCRVTQLCGAQDTRVHVLLPTGLLSASPAVPLGELCEA